MKCFQYKGLSVNKIQANNPCQFEDSYKTKSGLYFVKEYKIVVY
jgi:hypothetical protein